MWPAIAVIIASMIAKHMANKGAQDRQNSLQQAMQAYQSSRAKENESAIGNLVDQSTPQKRAAELQDLNASRMQSMTGTVDAARAASPVTAPAGASSDYQKSSAAAADTVAARTKRAIEQMGVMGAPGEAGIAQGLRFGRAAGKVDAGNTAIGNVGNAYMTDIGNVRPNPWLTMAGDAGMAVGGYMLGGPAGAAAAGGASAMGADKSGNYTYEDSAGNQQSSAIPYQTRRARMNNAFANWGR